MTPLKNSKVFYLQKFRTNIFQIPKTLLISFFKINYYFFASNYKMLTNLCLLHFCVYFVGWPINLPCEKNKDFCKWLIMCSTSNLLPLYSLKLRHEKCYLWSFMFFFRKYCRFLHFWQDLPYVISYGVLSYNVEITSEVIVKWE